MLFHTFHLETNVVLLKKDCVPRLFPSTSGRQGICWSGPALATGRVPTISCPAAAVLAGFGPGKGRNCWLRGRFRSFLGRFRVPRQSSRQLSTTKALYAALLAGKKAAEGGGAAVSQFDGILKEVFNDAEARGFGCLRLTKSLNSEST